jgi:hypothetical protein
MILPWRDLSLLHYIVHCVEWLHIQGRLLKINSSSTVLSNRLSVTNIYWPVWSFLLKFVTCASLMQCLFILISQQEMEISIILEGIPLIDFEPIRGWGNGVWRHFQQYFSYIEEVSFIGGGNWSPEKYPNLTQVTNKLLSHNVVSSTPHLERNSNSQL